MIIATAAYEAEREECEEGSGGGGPERWEGVKEGLEDDGKECAGEEVGEGFCGRTGG